MFFTHFYHHFEQSILFLSKIFWPTHFLVFLSSRQFSMYVPILYSHIHFITSKNCVPKGKNKSVDNIRHSGHFKVSDFYFSQYIKFDQWSKMVQKVVKNGPKMVQKVVKNGPKSGQNGDQSLPFFQGIILKLCATC